MVFVYKKYIFKYIFEIEQKKQTLIKCINSRVEYGTVVFFGIILNKVGYLFL